MDRSRREMLAGLPTTALAAAAIGATPGPMQAGARLLLDAGMRRVDRDTTIDGIVSILPGAGFSIARGATLTLLGDLDAPAMRVFEGEGVVDLSRGRVLAARPEWWGAIPDHPALDCGPALHACIRSHPWTQLGLGDYHLGATWEIDRPNRRVWGIGRTKGARGTRLVFTGDEGPVVRVGTEQPPAAINDYLRGVELRWIEIARDRPAPPPSGDDAAAATGLAIRHVLDGVFEGLRANEHAIGFSIRGAVRSFVRDCAAFRSLASTSGRDVFIGFDMDGRSPPIATGANASLHVIDCVASTGARPALHRSLGCRLQGAFSDTFLVRFETTDLATGILVAATQTGGARFQNVDLRIESPVLDQCGETGLTLTGLAPDALVDIISPYVALAPGGRAALEVERSGGLVSIAGGQCIGALAPGAIGLSLVDAAGVSTTGLKLAGFGRPVAAVGASGFDLVLGINTAGAEQAAAPAVTFARCHTGYCRPHVLGPAGIHAIGVALDRASAAAVVVEPAGIDPHTAPLAVAIDGVARRVGVAEGSALSGPETGR